MLLGKLCLLLNVMTAWFLLPCVTEKSKFGKITWQRVFGSAGVIGNPMGYARSVGHSIKDFLSVPARSVFQSPAGLVTGMAQGTTSLLSNTVFAISDAATQFSRATHKGTVTFTFDDQVVAEVENQQKAEPSHNKGVVNEFIEIEILAAKMTVKHF